MVSSLHPKKIVCILFVHVLMVLVFIDGMTYASREKCSTCKNIVQNFKEGLEKTKKSNFGGGNTRWEEKSLGAWAHSETRLIEIWENFLCKDSKECHLMLERHEEDMEDFWFNVHAKDENADMHEWLCIERIKVCCPANTYGPKCTKCPGEKDRPCKGNGKCDGEGTREGTGKCKCDKGYHGDLCDDCTDGHFEESKNDTHTTCTACHMSCQSTCWEAGPKGCDECKKGWLSSETEGCQDVDECAESPCDENQYCSNTDGSYVCATCHKACQGCSSYGADKCEECKSGYRKQEGTENCVDINECAEDPSLCVGEKISCENNDGGYRCKCEDKNYVYEPESKTCIPKPKDRPRSTKSKEKKKLYADDKNRPGLYLLLAMVVVFYVCGSIVQWNLIIVFCLSIVFGVFVYWFGSQHDIV